MPQPRQRCSPGFPEQGDLGWGFPQAKWLLWLLLACDLTPWGPPGEIEYLDETLLDRGGRSARVSDVAVGLVGFLLIVRIVAASVALLSFRFALWPKISLTNDQIIVRNPLRTLRIEVSRIEVVEAIDAPGPTRSWRASGRPCASGETPRRPRRWLATRPDGDPAVAQMSGSGSTVVRTTAVAVDHRPRHETRPDDGLTLGTNDHGRIRTSVIMRTECHPQRHGS